MSSVQPESQEQFTGPVFIVGMPRSGTKLLREILLRNRRLRIPRLETDFYPQLTAYVRSHGGPEEMKRDFARFYRWVQRFRYFKYGRRRGVAIRCEEWFDLCTTFTAADIFESLIRHDVGAPKGAALVWGDKSPSYVSSISLLAREFPCARIVHIVRDVRDQVLSVKRLWGKDPLRAAQRWTDDVGSALQQAARVGNRCKLVRYEELVSDPAAVVRSVCEFIGLEFDETMLTLDRPAEKAGVARGQLTIIKGNYNKFLSGFSERELARIEAIAGDLMRQLGYLPLRERTGVRLSNLSMGMRRLKDVFALVRKRSSISGWGWLSSIRFYMGTR